MHEPTDKSKTTQGLLKCMNNNYIMSSTNHKETLIKTHGIVNKLCKIKSKM